MVQNTHITLENNRHSAVFFFFFAMAMNGISILMNAA
jgi:hypothetical protein